MGLSRQGSKPTLALTPGQLVECLICGVKLSYESGAFTRHLRQFHNTKVVDYFLKYVGPGSDMCMCGCGGKTVWYSMSGGRFADFIRGHHLNADNSIKPRDMSVLKEPEQFPKEIIWDVAGSAIPDCNERKNGFLTIKQGLYVSTKTGQTHAFQSLEDLNLMIALDTSVIRCETWDKSELVIQYDSEDPTKKKRLSYVIIRDGRKICLTQVSSYDVLTEGLKNFCEYTSMVTGAPSAIISYRPNHKRWFIVWSTTEFNLCS